MKLRIPKTESLLPKQPEGVQHLIGGRDKLLLDDMGFGKTCQAIVAANTLGLKKILILCPPSVRFQWGHAIEQWSVIDYHVDVAVGETHNFNIKDRAAIVCPFNLLLSPYIYEQLKGLKWGAMIVDEIQNCKSIKARRTKAVLGRSGLWRNSVYRWGLSGTPMTTTPIDLWPIAKTLGRKHFKMTWMQYTKQFCGRFMGPWGWDVGGATNLSELRNVLFDTGFALRRERPDRPGGLRFVYVDEKPQPWKNIDNRIDVNRASLGLPAGELSALRKQAGEEKIEAAVAYLKDRALTGQKVVVFTWHRNVTEQIAQQLKPYYWQPEIYYGGMSPHKKEHVKKEFIEGDCDLLVANISSAGVGLDGLQRVCSYCIFAEVPWNFTDIDQAFKRLDREGQKLPAVGDMLLVGNSAEDHVLSSVVRKEDIFKTTFGKQCSPN